MTEDISMVNVSGDRVGMIGLKDIFNDIKEKGITDQETIKHELIQRVKSKNYITEKFEVEYAAALFREYRRFLGEEVEEEDSGIQIKILGPGCASCDRLKQETMTVLAELDISVDLEHIKDTKEIARYGVMGTPALIINKKVKSVGKVPGREQIKRWIMEVAE
ncbi:MAG: thioredoxin family protein [Nitrospiraceae bacterium]|nr:MAG: thioredoxin family protein [Nitrospiraceae bacterium]